MSTLSKTLKLISFFRVDSETFCLQRFPINRHTSQTSSISTVDPNLIQLERGNSFLSIFLIAAMVIFWINPTYAGKPGVTNNTGTSYVPMSMEYENYNFRGLSGDNSCLGEDDVFTWKAVGSLKPGESFTFTPKYSACNGHPAEISVVSTWQSSVLQVSSNVPDNDFASWDSSQKGKQIIAPVVGNSAQLCMFPLYQSDGIDYTITVTNVGQATANNVIIDGHSNNDWASNYYKRCLNADADHDGWNDSLEHSMANLVYPIGYINGQFQPYILWGTNYLKAEAESGNVNDEIDGSPADFNDDGIIDNRDVDAVTSRLGEGNGIPLESISPNPSDAGYYWANVKKWRRYDLDGDGYVAQTDINIVQSLVGQLMPMLADTIPPTARVIPPLSGIVPKGNYYQIQGHVWDNSAISKVEYLVDGKTVCSLSGAAYACWWNVPKRQVSHTIEIRVQDAAGNITVSDTATVSAI